MPTSVSIFAFMEGRWRMSAYVGSNTEHLIEDVVADAKASLNPGSPST